MRVGIGIDAHRLGGPPPVRLAGVIVDHARGVEATSDGDVVAHAVADALLGAAALGDLGSFFPSSDPRWHGVDSLSILAECLSMSRAAGVAPSHVDVTVMAETVTVSPHRDDMRAKLAEVLGLPMGSVSVKATTTDRLGFLGREEGLAALAVVTADTIP